MVFFFSPLFREIQTLTQIKPFLRIEMKLTIVCILITQDQIYIVLGCWQNVQTTLRVLRFTSCDTISDFLCTSLLLDVECFWCLNNFLERNIMMKLNRKKSKYAVSYAEENPLIRCAEFHIFQEIARMKTSTFEWFKSIIEYWSLWNEKEYSRTNHN